MAGKRGTRREVAAKWRERLARWQRLQCSISEFCRREGISQPSFFQWRRRLAAEKPDGRNAATPRGAAFIPVQVLGRAPSFDDDARLEITLGDFQCRLPLDVDESTLRQLVRVLCEETARC